MSDQQKVIAFLTVLSDNCTQALAAISSAATQEEESQPIPVSILRKDFNSLLSFLYAAVTKVALTLKPSSPAYSASLSPLKDVASNVASVTHCVGLLEAKIHGAIFTKTLRTHTIEVIENVKALAETLSTTESSSTRSGTGQAGEEYMVRVGATHESIDRARNCPENNLAAVIFKWKQDRGSLEDGLREVKEMIEEEENDNDGEEFEEDGWDEIGLSSGDKMSPEELGRTKQVHTVMRLTTLLHKRIHLDLLKENKSSNNTTLDGISEQSLALVSSTDDLAAALYTPQDPTRIYSALSSLVNDIDVLQKSVHLLTDEMTLANGISDLNLRDVNAENAPTEIGKEMDKKIKWFSTCFSQIHGATKSLDTALQNTPDNSSA